MSSYAQLQNDIKAYMKRQDIDARIPSWVAMCETDIAEMLRARCMIVSGTQAIDAPTVNLPADFIRFNSVRFQCCGGLLTLEDEWTGPLACDAGCTCGCYPPSAVTSYRLVGSCIEFLPHPQLPDPPDPSWQPQVLDISWFARPRPLVDPADTNPVLDTHYAVYLTGCVRYGAQWGMDDDREQQMTTRFAEAVAVANRWKEDAQYSGAPLRAALACAF